MRKHGKSLTIGPSWSLNFQDDANEDIIPSLLLLNFNSHVINVNVRQGLNHWSPVTDTLFGEQCLKFEKHQKCIYIIRVTYIKIIHYMIKTSLSDNDYFVYVCVYLMLTKIFTSIIWLNNFQVFQTFRGMWFCLRNVSLWSDYW